MCETKDTNQGQRRQALEAILESSRADYEKQCAIFSELDHKAQGATTLAGAFLAAALAFVKLEELRLVLNLLGVTGLIILGATIAILIFVVGSSIWATALRNYPLPPDPQVLLQATNDVLALTETKATAKHFENIMRQEIELWESINSISAKINREKSQAVLNSQFALSIAIVTIAIFLFIVMFAIFAQPK